MITVTFYKSADLIYGFKVSGHSDYSDEGNDIVCAAVSSATFMTANTITEIQHIKADVTDGDGLINLTMPPDEADKASDVLSGFELHLTALSEQYKKYIKVKYSEV